MCVLDDKLVKIGSLLQTLMRLYFLLIVIYANCKFADSGPKRIITKYITCILQANETMIH